MATLSADISATDRHIRVTGGTSAMRGLRFRLDDELLDLAGFEKFPNVAGKRERGDDKTRWIVTRGVAGTTPASHSSGAMLMAAVSATVSGESLAIPTPFVDGAAGEQTIRLLGPFRISFDTPDISDVGISLPGSEVSAGTVFVRTWAAHIDPVTPWNPAGSVELQVFVWEEGLSIGNLSIYDGKSAFGQVGGEYARIGTNVQNLSDHPFVSPVAASIGVYVDIASGTATEGAADIYALIAEPAE